MPVGLAIYNTDGVLQIDESFKNPCLVATGYLAGTGGYDPTPVSLSALGIDVAVEMPIILIRPRAYGRWFGGCRVYRGESGVSYFETYTSEVGLDYAIFSTKGTPIRDPGNVGLQVFDSSGAITFDSNLSHMRVLSSHYHPAIAAYQYPVQIGISNFQEMPWVVSAPLVCTWKGLGSSESEPEPLGLFMNFFSNTSATAEMCYLARQEQTAYAIRFAQQGGQPNAVINTQRSIIAQDPYYNRGFSVDFATWA